MKFNSIGLQNFRSFGNNYQELVLGKNGLTALVGKNGSGKTSLAEAIEFAIYGKVRGRKKKQANKATLANRHNKNLCVKLNFNDGIIVDRRLQPDSLDIKKEGVDASTYLKKEILRMPEEMYANFISFNSKDFKDFLHLSKHDRDALLDKLFNLKAFEELYNYVEKLNDDNIKKLQDCEQTYKKYAHTANAFLAKIKQVKEKRKNKNEEKITILSDRISQLKPEFEKLQAEIDAIVELKGKLEKRRNSMLEKSAEVKAELSQIIKKLTLYDEDKCPECGSELNTPTHVSTKENLLLRKARYETALQLGNKNLTLLKDEIVTKSNVEKELQENLNNVCVEVKTIKRQQAELEELDTEEDQDWTEQVEQLKEKAKDLKIELSKLERLKEAHNCLMSILDVDKNREELLLDLVPKLNVEVFKNVQKVGMPFLIRFAEDLSCEVEQLGSKIDEDSLSEGEAASLNSACFLAILKLAKIGKYTNLIFMDEVFEKLDEDNVKTILSMIRNYAKEEGLEVFLVQQRQTMEECFDRIVKIEKKMMFSQIIQQ